jgi:hypothetical protein
MRFISLPDHALTKVSSRLQPTGCNPPVGPTLPERGNWTRPPSHSTRQGHEMSRVRLMSTVLRVLTYLNIFVLFQASASAKGDTGLKSDLVLVFLFCFIEKPATKIVAHIFDYSHFTILLRAVQQHLLARWLSTQHPKSQSGHSGKRQLCYLSLTADHSFSFPLLACQL